MQTEISLLFLI